MRWPDFEVPTGWFCVGKKEDVPRDARYVGCHGDCYVWVLPEHVSELSQFALIVLAITDVETKELISSHRLTFTR
jgi:hypothetical protein